MSETARTVHSLQDIGKLFDDEPYPQAAKVKSEVDRALDGLREGEQAKLVSLICSKSVQEAVEKLGVRIHRMGVGGYSVMIGSREAWDRLYGLSVPVYWTVAFWQDGKWKEKKRPKQKKYPARWRPFSFRDRERVGLYDESPWPEFFDPFPDHDADLMLELKWERLVARYKTVASIIQHAEPEMLARWGVIEGDNGEERFEDVKTGRIWEAGALGPVYTPGKDPEPAVCFVWAKRPAWLRQEGAGR